MCALYSGDLHQYHTRIDEFLERILSDMSKALIQKLISVLDSTMKKLARYDEGSFFAQILSLTVRDHFVGSIDRHSSVEAVE